MHAHAWRRPTSAASDPSSVTRSYLPVASSTSSSRSTPHPDLPLDRYLSQRSVHRINTDFPGVQLINEEPFVFLIRDFLSGDECASLLATIRSMEPRPSGHPCGARE